MAQPGVYWSGTTPGNAPGRLHNRCGVPDYAPALSAPLGVTPRYWDSSLPKHQAGSALTRNGMVTLHVAAPGAGTTDDETPPPPAPEATLVTEDAPGPTLQSSEASAAPKRRKPRLARRPPQTTPPPPPTPALTLSRDA